MPRRQLDAFVPASLPATARDQPVPEVTGETEPKRKFKTYPIGHFHVDITEVQTAEGKLRLFLAINRTSKFAFVELHREPGKRIVCQFLRNLVAAVPHVIHTVLTDNGVQFINIAQHKYAFHHIFDRVCDEHEIEHRLPKIKHPKTNGQVALMNRTIKEATVKRYHYDNHAQVTAYLHDFINAYNYGRRLKNLLGLTPYEYICKCWTHEPECFNLYRHH